MMTDEEEEEDAITLAAGAAPTPLSTPAFRSIAWSSRILAALRANESLRTSSPPLVIDPVASLFRWAPSSHIPPAPSSSPPLPPQASLPYSVRSHVHLHHTHYLFRAHGSLPQPVLHSLSSSAVLDSVERPDTLIRCRYIDELLTAHVREGWQVVLMGAGLDGRAWRMDALRGARVYEVDLEDVLAWKRRRLEEAGCVLKAASVEYVYGDLRLSAEGEEADGGARTGKVERVVDEAQLDPRKARDRRALRALQRRRTQQRPPPPSFSPPPAAPAWSSALAQSSFSPALPTVWVLEGVAVYLNLRQLRAVLRAAATMCCAGSVLTFDHCTRREGRWHSVFSSEMGREEAVRVVEGRACGGWKVGGRRGGAGGYRIDDGVRGVGRDEISYDRYLRDRMIVKRKDGSEVDVQSFLVTAVRAVDG